MIFHWTLSDSKSPQVSRTLLSILADFNNAVAGLLISKSFSIFINVLEIVPLLCGLLRPQNSLLLSLLLLLYNYGMIFLY